MSGELRKSLLDNEYGASKSSTEMSPMGDTEMAVAKEQTGPKEMSKRNILLLSLVAPVIVGLGNKVFLVLMYVPFYNYPLFVNLFTTMFFVPVCFAYIIPMIKYGHSITPEQRAIPQRKWAVMGGLDSLAGIMNALAVNYIQNGSLVTLVGQANIPISLLLCRWLLKTRLNRFQIIGSCIIIVGLVIVLIPQFTSNHAQTADNLPVWVMLLILSCIPATLSNVYKEKSLGELEIDPVYLNGWVAVYQTLFALPLLLPSAPASNLSVRDVPANLWDGLRCFGGVDTVLDGKHPDDCRMGATYLMLFLAFNITYNMLLIVILKVAGTTVLYLSNTLLIPLSNVVFSLKFMPQSRSLGWNDIVGLVFIMSGLFVYRFLNRLWNKYVLHEDVDANAKLSASGQQPSDAYLSDGDATSDHLGVAGPDMALRVSFVGGANVAGGAGNAVRLSTHSSASAAALPNRYVNLPQLFVQPPGIPDPNPTATIASTQSNDSLRTPTPRSGSQPTWSLNSQGALVKRTQGTMAAKFVSKSIIDFPDD